VRIATKLFAYWLAVWVWTIPLSAHLGHAMGGGERRITLDLSDERAPRLEIGLGLTAESARAERASADRNRDGRVSAEEGNARLDQLAAELAGSIEVCIGESLARTSCHKLDSRSLDRAGASGWDEAGNEPRAIELAYRLVLDDARALEIREGWQRPEVTRSDIRIVPSAQSPLRRAGPNRDDPSVTLEFAYDDALLAGAPRTIVVELPPVAPRHRTLAIAVVAAIALGVAFVGYRLRRKRVPG
jgi:hypothetical protein